MIRCMMRIRCYCRDSFSFGLWFCERGSAAVETALLLPLIIAGGLLCTDLFKIGIERSRMEQLAGSSAITLSVQQKLGKSGLDGLYETLFHVDGLNDVRGQHQMVISNVTMPSRRIWWSLGRGTDGVCEQGPRAGTYDGTLPQDDADAGSGDAKDDTYSLLVVRLCRTMDDVSLDYLLLPSQLAVVSANRALAASIDLDSQLLAEAAGAIRDQEQE